MPPSSIQLLGLRIDALHLSDLLRQVVDTLNSGQRARIFYANIHCVNTSLRNPEHRRILNHGDIVYCDGAGVRLGARLLGQSLPPRMTGADWIHDLCARCVLENRSLFLLGGEPGIADQARQTLCRRHPGLRVAGTHHGFVAEAEEQDLIDTINASQAHILLVGMGTPMQELWIDRHFDRLDVPILWAVGALMDFVTGKAHRAPHWMLNHGLEWLFRLLCEPRRLGKRYLVGNVTFGWQVLRERGRILLQGATR